MTQKQIAERLGVDVKRLDYEFMFACNGCRAVGGTVKPMAECKTPCRPIVRVVVKTQ
jgi:hypothetical protein